MAEGDIFKASVIGQVSSGSGVVFDFGYADKNSGGTRLDTGIAAGNFQTLVQEALVNALTANYTFIRYRFACVGGPNAGDIGYTEVTPAVVGDRVPDAGAALPTEICISIKRNTGRSSRRDRGRIFLGPVDPYYQVIGKPDQVKVAEATLTAVADLLKTPLVVAGRTLTPVLVASNGTTNGYTIVNTSVGRVFTHRKSRRDRLLV